MFIKNLDKAFIQKWIKETNEIIQIYSPWLSSFGTEVLFDLFRLKANVKIEIYFRFDILDIAQGFIDLNGLNKLKREGCNLFLYDNPNLHAKLFIKDKQFVIFGSCNFTEKAFSSNLEIGVLDDYNEDLKNIISKWSFRQISQIQINTMLEEVNKLSREQINQGILNESVIDENTKFRLYGIGLR